jgi:hypothetical protein
VAGVFGGILVGSREALEGEWTPMAMMAMGMTGIDPSLRRRNSMDVTAMQEIAALYGPGGAGASAAAAAGSAPPRRANSGDR